MEVGEIFGEFHRLTEGRRRLAEANRLPRMRREVGGMRCLATETRHLMAGTPHHLAERGPLRMRGTTGTRSGPRSIRM